MWIHTVQDQQQMHEKRVWPITTKHSGTIFEASWNGSEESALDTRPANMVKDISALLLTWNTANERSDSQILCVEITYLTILIGLVFVII